MNYIFGHATERPSVLMTLPSKDQENKLDNYRELKIEKKSIRQIEIYYFKQVIKLMVEGYHNEGISKFE